MSLAKAGPSAMPMPLVPGEAEPEEEDIGGRGEEDWCVGGEMRRPMNAFFIFCKRHRSVVRERYPHLENRSITKILGEWWATLESDEKNTYTELAKQYKEAFMKANPDFKWCKMPTPTTRTLLTRTKGGKGDSLRWSPDHPRAEENHAEGDLPRLPTPKGNHPRDPTGGDRREDGVADAVEERRVKLGPAISTTEPPPPPPPPVTANPAPAALNPPMSCKPPKKRYLENMENGTYGSGNAAAARVKADSSPSPSPSPSPAPCGVAQPAGRTSTDQQTNNACTALLELAEGCQTTKKPACRPKPPDFAPATESREGGSSPPASVAPRGFGPIPMFDVCAANRIIDQAFSQTAPTTTAGPASVTAAPPFLATTAAPPAIATASNAAQTTAAAPAGGFFNVSSAKSLAQSLSRAEDEEEPLNLSKEKPTTTIKACQQDIIDHIIEKFLCGPSNVAPLDGTVFSADGSSRHPEENVALAAAIAGAQPQPRAALPPPSGDGEDSAESPRRPSKAGVARRKGPSASSPNKRARLAQAQDEDGGSSPERGESAGSRKSQRSCKGQRYQALLSEGVLPGAAKERKGGKRGEGEEEDGGREEGEEDADRGRRKGCREEDGGGKASRKASGSFNLDAQIAALPKCSMDSFTRRRSNKKKCKGGAEDGEFACRDDRFQSDTDPSKDPDFRPSPAGRRPRHRSESGASNTDNDAPADGPDSPEEAPCSPGGSRDLATPKKFKTGDFDLDEHLAALPRCDIEVLSRRRKELRRDSGSSSGKQGSKVEDSGTESDQGAGSESTEENGVRDWHSGEEEEAGEGGRTSPKKDKRKKGKVSADLTAIELHSLNGLLGNITGAVRRRDLPSGWHTLGEYAVEPKGRCKTDKGVPEEESKGHSAFEK
ncbi:SOX transcription factor, putative [Ixodes scapularis]|uniref:SOX transcription factor, putative n=1 Tax=Ixodes scapularis TaxID=6945 RepID=B7Q1R9_IXOSC|nr:SOX transcription factor, putative [Ixodes scapularis]|eukprot:XP_002410034.1 SOX transcription factor, putative [Ixodes scapularis]